MAMTLHTIDSGIVKDVLSEVAKKDMTNEFLGGGMGAQFYLPKHLYRLTSDIDFDGPDKRSYSNFQNYVENSTEDLTKRGYELFFEKQRETYDAVFLRDNQKVTLQIPRRSKKKQEEFQKRLERELENAKILDYAGGKVRVINVNDLIAHKLGRADVFRREYNLPLPEFSDSETCINKSNDLKKSLETANFDPVDYTRRIANIRMLADLADIKALIENTEIDDDYVKMAISDFHTRDHKSLENLMEEIFA